MRQVQFNPTPKQWRFLTSTADEVLLSGAWGAGKSFPLCLGLYLRAQFPGAREGLFRRTLQKLYETTLVTLLEGDGQTPPVIPKGTYDHNQQRRTISLHGGGKIFYGPAETEEDVNAHNLTGAAVDECNELRADIWGMLGARCRVKIPGLKPQLRGACNPSTPSHHLAKRFGIRRNVVVDEAAFRGDEKNPIACEAILTNSFENPYLPAEALARYASYTGITRQRYVLGEWVGSDGLIYDNFSRESHVKSRSGPWSRVLIGIDDATTVETCILMACVDGENRVHIEREVQRPGMFLADKLAHVRSMGEVEVIVVDPAAAGLKAELREVGYAVVNADNAVETGIQRVREALAPRMDGQPGVTIDPSCQRLVEQMESYERNPNTTRETPIKENDHGPDALRYILTHIKQPPPMVFDLGGVAKAEEKAKRAHPPVIGTMTHEETGDRERDLSIADGRVADIGFDRVPDGPMKLWVSLMRGRPPLEDDFVIFAAAGDAGCPGVLVVADATRRTIAAQWSKVCPPERMARVAAMLALWFGSEDRPAPIGYLANTPGKVFGLHIGRLGVGGAAWEPTPLEFGEAVGALRAAWEGGQLVERDPAVFAAARQYVYVGSQMMHASLAGVPERRAGHADTVIARAGLWRMLVGIAAKPAPIREAPPGSPEYRRREREAREKKSKSIHFG